MNHQPIIAESARKHSVSDDDLLHAYGNPIDAFELDEGLTMLVGPDAAGNLVEIGVVDGDLAPVIVHGLRPARRRFRRQRRTGRVMTVPRSTREILEHADELAARFEGYEPDDSDPKDAAPLRELRAAVLARADADRRIAAAVAAARAAGLTWSSIGAMLGTSGEAARQKYGSALQV